MLTNRLFALLLGLGVGIGLFGWSPDAAANATCVSNGTSGNTCTIVNTDTAPTTVVQSTSLGTDNASTSFFSSGSAWGANVGGETQINNGDYTTQQLTAVYNQGTGGNGSVTLVFNTLFAQTCAAGTSKCGIDPVTGSASVYAGDIFLESNAGTGSNPSSGQSFNYAIALGYTSAVDGGKSLGVYAGTYGGSNPNNNSEDKTSDDVWGTGAKGANAGISGWYGGAFAAASACTGSGSSLNCNTSVQSPTVVTGTTDAGGAALAGLTVGECWNYLNSSNKDATYSATGSACSSTTDSLAVTISGSDTMLATLFSDFDIFWGTGDCSNAPIWGNMSSLMSVPEPSSLALILTAVAGFVVIRRRNRIPSTIA